MSSLLWDLRAGYCTGPMNQALVSSALVYAGFVFCRRSIGSVDVVWPLNGYSHQLSTVKHDQETASKAVVWVMLVSE